MNLWLILALVALGALALVAARWFYLCRLIKRFAEQAYANYDDEHVRELALTWFFEHRYPHGPVARRARRRMGFPDD